MLANLVHVFENTEVHTSIGTLKKNSLKRAVGKRVNFVKYVEQER